MTSRTVTTFDGDGNVVEETTETVPVEDANARSLFSAADQALTNNRTFLALSSPTAAQNAAQVKALTRQMNGVIRLLLGRFDGTD